MGHSSEICQYVSKYYLQVIYIFNLIEKSTEERILFKMRLITVFFIYGRLKTENNIRGSVEKS